LKKRSSKPTLSPWKGFAVLLMPLAVAWASAPAHPQDPTPLKYHHPGLAVDLGVGLWALPLPMDFDGDGDYDLVVACPDKPYNGTYFFENVTGNVPMPIFRPGVRIGPGHHSARVSRVGSEYRVLIPGRQFRDFSRQRFEAPEDFSVPRNIHTEGHKIRANQWQLVDFDGDGRIDLTIGVGDWHDYGWDDAFNEKGEWTRGPLHGVVYVLANTGSNDKPVYATPKLLRAGGERLEVYGYPSPNFEDFDGDGDLDILCGEFLDRFTYFENVGSRKEPRYAAGRFLKHQGEVLRMDLQMVAPSAIDWDRDGDVDLIVGDEDGRVAFVEHSGALIDGLPHFYPPRYFQQQANKLKFGALVTPFGVDWDQDGDDDLVCGNTAGHVAWFENLGPATEGAATPRWGAARFLEADGKTLRIQAGESGSIQGPCEAKWGYTTLHASDWDHDGRIDLILNSIWGEVLWYPNVGTPERPVLAAARRLQVEWEGAPPKPAWTWWTPQGKQLVTQWRTTPCTVDWSGDGLTDLVMLDHEGYLSLFERRRVGGGLQLLPGRRIFVDPDGSPLRLNARRAGKSGRRKLQITDWDGDGLLDILVNSRSADFLRNLGKLDTQVQESDGEPTVTKVKLQNVGPLTEKRLSGHSTSPTVVDWNQDGIPDLVIGTESGFLFYLENPRTERP